MANNEILLMSAYFLGATVLCLGGILAFGAVLNLHRQTSKWFQAFIYILLLAAIGISPIMANRNLAYADSEVNMVAITDSAPVVWTQRMFLLALLGISFARFLSEMNRTKKSFAPGRPLYVAFLAFFITNIAITSYFGTVPVFDHKVFYALILFSAVFLSRKHELEYSIRGAKIGLWLFMAGSIAVAMAVPRIAVQPDYLDGWIPLIRFRLWGLGQHANTLGPLSLVFILVLLYQPFKSKWLQYSSLLLGALILLLSQSKTAWFSAIICLSVYLWGYNKSLGRRLLRRRRSLRAYLRKISGPMILGAAGIMAVAVLAVLAMNLIPVKPDSQAGDIASLSGRTSIWSVAIDAWKGNPLFGYGLSIWGPKFRQAIDMNYAFSAHNQFLQSLSGAGSLGLAGLVFYLLVLGRYAYRANRATKGFSLALYSIILIRCFTETPFAIDNIFAGEFVIHLLLFRTALDQIKSNRKAVYHQMQQQLQWG